MKSARTMWMSRPGLGLGLGWLTILSGVSLALPFPQNDPATSPDKVLTAYLEYAEAHQSLRYHGVVLERQTERFAKEPNLGSQTVQRARLRIGSSADQAVPLIWSLDDGKLYLDLNRNRDLTDDPAGVRTCLWRGARNTHQSFTNVSLTFQTSAGIRRQLLDLNLYRYRNNLSASAQLRSFWTSKISLRGEEWQIGMLEGSQDRADSTADTQLFLRPWEERDQPFSAEGGTLDVFRSADRLFFRNQMYNVGLAWVKREEGPVFKVQLTEQPVTLGALELSGQFIHRLILRDSQTVVVLDEPPRVVRVPAGTYTESQVHLKHGEQQARRTDGLRDRLSLTVGATEQAVLKVGGPLTNEVTVQARGRHLSLRYALIGADGYQYRLRERGPRQNPRFAIFRGGKEIASGRFEFG